MKRLRASHHFSPGEKPFHTKRGISQEVFRKVCTELNGGEQRSLSGFTVSVCTNLLEVLCSRLVVEDGTRHCGQVACRLLGNGFKSGDSLYFLHGNMKRYRIRIIPYVKTGFFHQKLNISEPKQTL